MKFWAQTLIRKYFKNLSRSGHTNFLLYIYNNKNWKTNFITNIYFLSPDPQINLIFFAEFLLEFAIEFQLRAMLHKIEQMTFIVLFYNQIVNLIFCTTMTKSLTLLSHFDIRPWRYLWMQHVMRAFELTLETQSIEYFLPFFRFCSKNLFSAIPENIILSSPSVKFGIKEYSYWQFHSRLVCRKRSSKNDVTYKISVSI